MLKECLRNATHALSKNSKVLTTLAEDKDAKPTHTAPHTASHRFISTASYDLSCVISIAHDLASPHCFDLLRQHPSNAKGTNAMIVDVFLHHASEIEQIPID